MPSVWSVRQKYPVVFVAEFVVDCFVANSQTCLSLTVFERWEKWKNVVQMQFVVNIFRPIRVRTCWGVVCGVRPGLNNSVQCMHTNTRMHKRTNAYIMFYKMTSSTLASYEPKECHKLKGKMHESYVWRSILLLVKWAQQQLFYLPSPASYILFDPTVMNCSSYN